MAMGDGSWPDAGAEHDADEAELYRQLSTLELSSRSGLKEDLRTTPLTTLSIKNVVEKKYGNESGGSRMFDQYAVLGFHNGSHSSVKPGEPILMNVNAPNSAFICGSQGSGKSYTLSCMLENCLVADERIGRVRQPLAGLAFHFDPDSAGGVAETAYLCSMGISVNVLVSQSNEQALRAAYSKIPGADKNLRVTPLLFRASDISIERMHRLMAFSDKDGAMPLYMSVVLRILRQMAISSGGSFDYLAFRKQLEKERLTKDQLGPLNLRLELLESYLDPSPASRKASSGSLLETQAGTLTIVDLTDPFVDPATACILFDICLSLVKEHRSSGGLVIALDEAHRYMTTSLASSSFTDRLLGTIREQRHNGCRVIIATQEPTVSEKLLDLCSVSIIHRFTSPAWFSALQHHLGAASKVGMSDSNKNDIFQHIMDLSVGESLVFAPAAYLCLEPNGTPAKLGRVAIDMKTRTRLGNDGGMSVLTSAHVESPLKLYGSERQNTHEVVAATVGSKSKKSKSRPEIEQQSSGAHVDEQIDHIPQPTVDPTNGEASVQSISKKKAKLQAKLEKRLAKTRALEQDELISFAMQPIENGTDGQVDDIAKPNEQSVGQDNSKKKKKEANNQSHDANASHNEKQSAASTPRGPTDRGLPASTPTGLGAGRATRSQSQTSNLLPSKTNESTPALSISINGKNKDPQSSHTNTIPSGQSSESSLDLSPERSHIFLICSLCQRLALIEFAEPKLPRLDVTVQKERKSGLAYTACATCRRKVDPTGTITSTAVYELEREEITKFSHGGVGPELSTLRKQLQTAAYISAGLPKFPVMFTDKSGPLFLNAMHIEAQIDDRCRLFSIEIVKQDGDQSVLSLKTRPHRREIFFQDVRNAGSLAEYARFGDATDGANGAMKADVNGNANGSGKGKANANSKEKINGSTNGNAEGKGKAEAKANGKAEVNAIGKVEGKASENAKAKANEKPNEKAVGKPNGKANGKTSTKAGGQADEKAQAAIPLEMW